MKAKLLFTLLFSVCAMSVSAQKTGLIKATYDTNYGKMSLSINLETRHVTGFYGGDGKILGTIDGNNRLVGTWVQKEQGMFELDFTSDFKNFTGKFGLGNTLTSGVWKGEGVSVEKVTGEGHSDAVARDGIYQGEYNTDYGMMKLEFDFKTGKVTGTYGNGGRINGSINDSNRVAGEWGRSDTGRFEFDFTPDLKKFTGKWGEKNNTLTDGVWMGECVDVKKK